MIKSDEYQLGSIIVFKKKHPSQTIMWKIVKVGADIKIKSMSKDGLIILMTRQRFNQKVKKIIKK